MKTLIFLLAFLPILATGQPSRNLYFDPVSHIITEDTITNPVCLERGHVWKRTQLKATKACESYIIDNKYYTIKVYPACDLTRSDCMRCGVRQKSTATDWVDTIWRKPKISRTIKLCADTLPTDKKSEIPINPTNPTHDTIPVIMLVCDTACYQDPSIKIVFNKTDSLYHMVEIPCKQVNNGKIAWLRGYEVRKRGFSENPSDPGSMLYNARVAYLDSNNKPVKYLVWDRKEVGK